MKDHGRNHVADSSTVISITASKHAALIVGAYPCRITVPRQVMLKLEVGRLKGHDSARLLHELINDGLVEVASSGKTATDSFVESIKAQAGDKLGNGEAGVMACALELDGVALLDDKKARHICSERFPGLAYGCTADIFNHPEVRNKLGSVDFRVFVVLGG